MAEINAADLVRARRITPSRNVASGRVWAIESKMLGHPFGDSPEGVRTYALFAYRVRAAAMMARYRGCAADARALFDTFAADDYPPAEGIWQEDRWSWVIATYPSARVARCAVLKLFLTPLGLAALNAWATRYAPAAPGPLVLGRPLAFVDIPTTAGVRDGRERVSASAQAELADAVRAILTDPAAVEALSEIMPRELRTARAAFFAAGETVDIPRGTERRSA